MADNDHQPSWMRFENFEGPSPEIEHEALQDWNLRKRAMGPGSGQSGGKLMFGTPRKGKCRDTKVNGLRIK